MPTELNDGTIHIGTDAIRVEGTLRVTNGPDATSRQLYEALLAMIQTTERDAVLIVGAAAN